MSNFRKSAKTAPSKRKAGFTLSVKLATLVANFPLAHELVLFITYCISMYYKITILFTNIGTEFALYTKINAPLFDKMGHTWREGDEFG